MQPASKVARGLAETDDLRRIADLLELAKAGKYPGTTSTRPRKSGVGVMPIWNQRTAILYFNRRQAGDALMWLTLAMGQFANAKRLVSNKKVFLQVWEKVAPVQFADMKKYLPKTWADVDSFEIEMAADNLYVYKPSLGSGGKGIRFERGVELSKKIREGEIKRGGFVIQEFVNPFLYNGKKTHMRPITLFIIQPDGTREFFIYNKMRLFTAPEEFDEERLLNGGDNSFMLLTNRHTNLLLFESDPNNAGKKFDASECVLDAETALGSADSILSFDVAFRVTKQMHSVIFSVIGNLLECKKTSVSLYNDACFQIMATDVAFDKDGTPFLLEMNTAMAYDHIWTKKEQSEYLSGAAALIKGTASPYEVTGSSMWERI
ncbi:unnamed protein product [Ectocarpus fasciculatus]